MSTYSFKPSLLALPDAVPRRQFRKKKTHGLADARGLTGTEIAALDLKAREALARNKAVVTPDSPLELRDDDEVILLVWLSVLALNSPGVCLAPLLSPGYSQRTLPFPRHQQPHLG